MAKPGRTVIPTALLRLSRRSDRIGRMAKLAIHIITETQHRDGPCLLGHYTVMAKRGSCVTSYRSLASVIDGKPETASRMLAEICADAGWDVIILGTSDTIERGGYTGGYTGGHQGRYIGVYITVSNYDDLQAFGGHQGGHQGGHTGRRKGGSIPTPYPSPSPIPKPTPIPTGEHVELVEGEEEPAPEPEPVREPEQPDDIEARAVEYRKALEQGELRRNKSEALRMLREQDRKGDPAARIVLDEANEAAAATSEMMRERWCDDQR